MILVKAVLSSAAAAEVGGAVAADTLGPAGEDTGTVLQSRTSEKDLHIAERNGESAWDSALVRHHAASGCTFGIRMLRMAFCMLRPLRKTNRQLAVPNNLEEKI